MSANSKYHLPLILLLAAIVRLPDLGYDLPNVYEEATPMRQAWEMWNWNGRGFDLNPHFFNYPGLYFYIQFLGQILYYGFGWLTGRFLSPNDLHAIYEQDPSELVLLARFINMAFGLLTILAVTRLGRLLSGPTVGLIAGAVLAVLPLAVHTSRTILVDTPLVFFLTLALCAIVEVTEDKNRSSRFSGLWIGLAGACKYTGAFLIVPFVLAHLLNAPLKQALKRSELWIGLALSGLVFGAASPFCLIDFPAFWQDFSLERQHMARGHFGVDPSGGVLTYGRDLWKNFGPWLMLPLLLGLGYRLANLKQAPRWVPPLIFTALYLGTIATWSMHAIHYLLPVFPCLAVLTARGTLDLHRLLHRRLPTWTSVGQIAALLLLAPVFLAIQAAFSPPPPDPRAQAQTWIRTHISHGALIAQEMYTPDRPSNPKNPSDPTLHIPIDVLHPGRTAPYYNLGWYIGFDYLITSETVSGRYRASPDRFEQQIRFYQNLAARWPLVAEFTSPTSGEGIRIHRNPIEPARRIDRPLSENLFQNMTGANLTIAAQFIDNLSLVFKQKGWYQMTASLYGGLIGLNPTDPAPYLKLARLLLERGKAGPALDRAVQILTQGLRRNPGNTDLQTALSEFKALQTTRSP